MAKKLLSTVEVAEILGISRIAVFHKIKKGDLKAQKVGRGYVIDAGELEGLIGERLTEQRKKEIEEAVEKTVAEYGETLRLLGAE